MRSPATRPSRQQPSWACVCLHSLLILGVFGMHQLMVGADSGSAQHGDMQMVSATVESVESAAVDSVATVAAVADDGGAAGLMADCGSLAMLCAAMVLGLGAFILLRQRSCERVLWQLPPPLVAGPSHRISPFQALTPLQRSSVVRC